MKRLLLLSAFIANLLGVNAQNQVLNGDFEQYSGCPANANQLDSALFWTNPHGPPYPPGGSPDYFNQCSVNVNVPNTPWGYQPAHSGVVYAGLVLWANSGIPDFREYLQVSLSAPLISNQCYHLEFYYNASNAFEFTSDDISAYFSDTLISGVNVNPLPYIPQINNAPGNYTDTLNWQLVQGNFTAAGGESYLMIGNFKNDASTNVISINQGPAFAYVYVDDVSLTPCTGIDFPNSQNLENLIYPNPVKDFLNVQFSKSNFQNKKTEIKITDVLGKEIYRNQFLPDNNRDDFRLPASGFKCGMYLIEINDGKNNYRKKFLKQ